MVTLCEGCGHDLWAEVRSAGAFRFLAHFDDDDERSATYAEHSPSCPSCGLKLDKGMTGPGAPEGPTAEAGSPALLASPGRPGVGGTASLG